MQFDLLVARFARCMLLFMLVSLALLALIVVRFAHVLLYHNRANLVFASSFSKHLERHGRESWKSFTVCMAGWELIKLSRNLQAHSQPAESTFSHCAGDNAFPLFATFFAVMRQIRQLIPKNHGQIDNTFTASHSRFDRLTT
jgi:hypothetical protein